MAVPFELRWALPFPRTGGDPDAPRVTVPARSGVRATVGVRTRARGSGREDAARATGRVPLAGPYSWTSSISVPKAVLGWMKATVVPRDPGRGTSSSTRPPWALTDSRATAQSSTR